MLYGNLEEAAECFYLGGSGGAGSDLSMTDNRIWLCREMGDTGPAEQSRGEEDQYGEPEGSGGTGSME